MHDNVIDDHLLSLDAEEALLRDALHKAVAAGHTSSVSKLIAAQAVLRNTALRLETFVVADKRELYPFVDRWLQLVKQLCKQKGYKYDGKKHRPTLYRIIEDARNDPSDPLRTADKRLASS